MKKIIIQGGKKLHGTISISGSKNASLPILASSILFDEKVVLENVPIVQDIITMVKLLETLGKKITIKKNTIIILSKSKTKSFADYKLVKTMRAGILVIGPILAKLKKAKVSLPGGCAIGARPVDIHLDFLSKAGYANKVLNGYVESKLIKKRKNISYKFKKLSVGATETAILNSVISDKSVILKNIATEPEIIDLINFLKTAGAKITFKSKRSILITGVQKLNGLDYRVMPDRIEAGTYIMASVITKSSLVLKNIRYQDIKNIISIFKGSGTKFEEINNNGLKIIPKLMKPMKIKTVPYPGFPTDMQAQLMSVLTLTKGSSQITEDIFENRFMHVLELKRMGAIIEIEHNKAKINGIKNLSGAEVMATDLRASVSLVLAGLAAKGKTTINRVYHLDRGYENLVQKLKKCGANIRVTNVR